MARQLKVVLKYDTVYLPYNDQWSSVVSEGYLRVMIDGYPVLTAAPQEWLYYQQVEVAEEGQGAATESST